MKSQDMEKGKKQRKKSLEGTYVSVCRLGEI